MRLRRQGRHRAAAYLQLRDLRSRAEQPVLPLAAAVELQAGALASSYGEPPRRADHHIRPDPDADGGARADRDLAAAGQQAAGAALARLRDTVARPHAGHRQQPVHPGRDHLAWHQGLDDHAVHLADPASWLSSFREADRLALLGLVGAALLAGAGIDWLRRTPGRCSRWPSLAAVEFGWAGRPGRPRCRARYRGSTSRWRRTPPARSWWMSRSWSAAQSGTARTASPAPLVLATADGHPRAISYTSGVQRRTITGIRGHAFYAGLVAAQAASRSPRPSLPRPGGTCASCTWAG